ncbi:MAG: hydrogenase maturation protease [Endomicrobiia bacterium]
MILEIKEFFNSLKDKKIVFIGLGNNYRSDDAVGCYIVEELQKRFYSDNIYFINSGIIVENYVNKIIKLNREVIIFVDAIRDKDFVNDFCIFTKDEIKNFTFSTHNISLSTIIEYLQTQQYIEYKLRPEIFVLGIKVNLLDFAEGLTEKTKNIADEIIEIINSSLNLK